MGGYQGLSTGTFHGVVMKSFKFASVLSLGWLVCKQLDKERYSGNRDPKAEMKKRFAYANN